MIEQSNCKGLPKSSSFVNVSEDIEGGGVKMKESNAFLSEMNTVTENHATSPDPTRFEITELTTLEDLYDFLYNNEQYNWVDIWFHDGNTSGRIISLDFDYSKGELTVGFTTCSDVDRSLVISNSADISYRVYEDNIEISTSHELMLQQKVLRELVIFSHRI